MRSRPTPAALFLILTLTVLLGVAGPARARQAAADRSTVGGRRLAALADVRSADPEKRRYAAFYLFHGDEALPAAEAVPLLRSLIRAAKDHDARALMLYALIPYGQAARPVVPDVLRYAAPAPPADDDRSSVPALEALAEIAPDDPRVVRAAVRVLRGETGAGNLARYAALKLMGNAGSAGAAVPAGRDTVVALLRSEDRHEQYLAFRTLARLRPGSAPTPAQAVALLTPPAGRQVRPEDQAAAFAALERAGRAAPAAAVPALTAILADAGRAYHLRRAAAEALGGVGPGRTTPAVTALLACVHDRYPESEDLMESAEAALRRIESGDTAALAPLVRALDSGGERASLVAGEVLGVFGENAVPAVPALTRRLDEALRRSPDAPDRSLRLTVFARTAARIGPKAAPTGAALTAALLLPLPPPKIPTDARKRLHAACLIALAAVGATPDDALPAIRSGLADRDTELTAAAARAAARLRASPGRAALAPLLTRTLLQEGYELDRDALRIRAPYAPFAGFSSAHSSSVALESARALAALGPDAAVAAPALRELLARLDAEKDGNASPGRRAYRTALSGAARAALARIAPGETAAATVK